MSGRLPSWLAERLGVSVPSSADGATWQLDSAWSWAPWATLLLVIAAVLWTVMLYARESSGAGRPYRALLTTLRIVAIGLLLIMLAQWAIALAHHRPARGRAGHRPLGQHGHRRSLRRSGSHRAAQRATRR